MNLLVTGANSFIGRHLLSALSTDQNFQITALVNPDSKNSDIDFRSTNIQVVPLQMSNYGKMVKHIPKSVDLYISFAWRGVHVGRNDSNLQKQNLHDSQLALQCVLAHGAKKIISAGSQAEYGEHHTAISENTPPIPTTEYGKNKLCYYNYAKEACDKYQATLIEPRYFSLYGPDDSKHTMIISTLLKMLHNEDCELTMGEQLWDFLYIDDAIQMLINLIYSDTASGIYNIASGIPCLLKDYILEMASLTKTQSRLIWGELPYQNNQKLDLIADVKKIKQCCGKINLLPFSEGIRNTINFIQKRQL